MAFKRFNRGLGTRFVLVGVAMVFLLWLATRGGNPVGTFIGAAIFLLLVVDLWRYVSRTNREIARFLEAARNADFSQRFSFAEFGAGFDELGEEFTAIIERLRERGLDRETEARKLRALIEHIPVALLTLHGDGLVTLQNNAARRLFGAAQITRLRDLRQFGVPFAEAVESAVPAERQLVEFTVEGVEYKLTLAATEIMVVGSSQRLVSLQDIQSELAATQAEAWQDLVSVLTHEIINSISPVTSLAASAAEVADVVIAKVKSGEPVIEELDDLKAAVSIVARRSESLTQFVDSYRQITRLAPAEKSRIQIQQLFTDVMTLARAEWSAEPDVSLQCKVTPAELDLSADRDLLEPVLLNLLRNAEQATRENSSPKIELLARLNKRGHVILEVSDNGPGVPPEIANKIFVPFFTTREGGSGIGLALARQVMTAHDGFIRVTNNDGGGALFRLTF